MVRFLLDNKADAKARTENCWTAMTLAARGVQDDSKDHKKSNAGYIAVIKTLHSRGVPLDLPTAIALKRTKLVAELLKKTPALANSKGPDGRPVLHQAVNLDRRKEVALLLDRGARVGITDKDGYTALHGAAFWGREEIARLLLDRRADVNSATPTGWTPLHEAVRLDTIGVARILLAAGAKVNAKDDKGQTPLKVAEESGHRWEENTGSVPDSIKEMIGLLRKYGGTN